MAAVCSAVSAGLRGGKNRAIPTKPMKNNTEKAMPPQAQNNSLARFIARLLSLWLTQVPSWLLVDRGPAADRADGSARTSYSNSMYARQCGVNHGACDVRIA